MTRAHQVPLRAAAKRRNQAKRAERMAAIRAKAARLESERQVKLWHKVGAEAQRITKAADSYFDPATFETVFILQPDDADAVGFKMKRIDRVSLSQYAERKSRPSAYAVMMNEVADALAAKVGLT